jgi:hypothetical protein
MTPASHLSYKRGCSSCSKSRYSQSRFLIEATQIHGSKYDYSKYIFKNVKSKSIIVCKIHNTEFLMDPEKHISRRQGCPTCNKRPRITPELFIERAKKVHGNKYGYSLIFNVNSNTHRVDIICTIHKIFQQSYASHVDKKANCIKCMVGKSKKEAAWLDSIGVPNEPEFRTVYLTAGDNKYIFDGYMPSTNTVYEFYGDYWHGNPMKYNPEDSNPRLNKTFKYLYEKTIARENRLKEHGFNLITIWETDWDSSIKNPLAPKKKYKQRK